MSLTTSITQPPPSSDLRLPPLVLIPKPSLNDVCMCVCANVLKGRSYKPSTFHSLSLSSHLINAMTRQHYTEGKLLLRSRRRKKIGIGFTAFFYGFTDLYSWIVLVKTTSLALRLMLTCLQALEALPSFCRFSFWLDFLPPPLVTTHTDLYTRTFSAHQTTRTYTFSSLLLRRHFLKNYMHDMNSNLGGHCRRSHCATEYKHTHTSIARHVTFSHTSCQWIFFWHGINRSSLWCLRLFIIGVHTYIVSSKRVGSLVRSMNNFFILHKENHKSRYVKEVKTIPQIDRQIQETKKKKTMRKKPSN